jgi:F1F0 ATPase subunit 2
MNDLLALAMAWLAGIVLGVLFFGGLWWTVRKALVSKQPTIWFLGSFLIRASIVLAGFYVVAGGHWDRLLASLIGFVIARYLVMRLAGLPAACCNAPAKETGHAS